MSHDELRNALDSLEHRILREIRMQLAPVKSTLDDVKRETQITNGRVNRLEEDRIRRDAADGVRAELAKQAVETAATATATAIEVASSRERSRKWWLAVASAAIAAVSVAVPMSTAAWNAVF